MTEAKETEAKETEAKETEAKETEGKVAGLTNLSGPVLVALFCALVLTITHLTTVDQIAANQQAHDQQALQELLRDTLPEPILLEATWLDDQLNWCTQNIVVSRLTTDGYAGPIELLLAWRSEHREIIGISVVRHLETPGIADFLNDRQQNSWLSQFRTRSADATEGIDTVTGATISSNAVKRAVAAALQMSDPVDSRCAE